MKYSHEKDIIIRIGTGCGMHYAVKETFQETFQETSLQGQTYRICNLMGQVLLQGQVTDERQMIDVSGLSEGMYFVTVGNYTQKIVVNR